MTDYAIEIAHLCRVYKAARRRAERRAVDDVSLSVRRGEWVALLGPNGSGKSSLLRIIATLDQPDGGTVRWFGECEVNVRAVRARLGVVFQSPALDALLTISENLMIQAAVFGLAPERARKRIAGLAEELRIADRLDDRVGALSGGLTRRADLARALLPNPAMLLLDEPTAGLDPPAREEFLAALSRRHETEALTIVMTTHLLNEAERAERVVMMDSGRIVADGSPSHLRSSLAGAGSVAIRTPWRWRDELASLVGEPSRAGDEAIVSVSQEDEATLTNAVRTLTALGASVTVGPPTLEDVFAARSGHTLVGEETAL